MIKNDYRRALIMFRAHEKGASGHIRLEHRTLTGSMYFVVSAPSDGALCAVLVRRDNKNGYVAVKLGELRRDGRGQATLAYAFDPRNITGRPLDDYALAAVVQENGADCRVLLSGNINGSKELDWNAVRSAACAACQTQQEPACDLRPREVEPLPVEEPQVEELAPRPDLRLVEEAPTEAEAPEENPTESLLTADVTIPWPGVSEALRERFARTEQSASAPDDGYYYIQQPMPEGSGYDSIEIGLLAEDGVPVSVAYALPGRFSPEPPPGQEESEWVGNGSEGWWVVYTDAQTGNPLS